MILLTLPFQIVIAVILFVYLNENPIFLQRRGLTNEKFCFTIIKFRTIKSAKIKSSQHHTSKDIFLMSELAVNLNGFEKWLRKSGLDELPQLYNVFIGQMSFIGPRPLMMQDLEIMKNEFPQYYKLRGKINSKPGITGLWQIFGDRTLGVENLVELDLRYEKNKSFKLDLQIFMLTISVVLLSQNSDAILPRINFIGRLFSLSSKEFINNENNLNVVQTYSKEKLQSYSVKIPWTWWFMNDTYSNTKRPNEKSSIYRMKKNQNKRQVNYF